MLRLCAIILVLFCVSSLGLTTASGDNKYEYVSSTFSLATTGKRTEDGDEIKLAHFRLSSSNLSVLIPVRPSAPLVAPECVYEEVDGAQVLKSIPCPRLEAYEAVEEGRKVYFAFLDEKRQIMKGFFDHNGEQYYVDPLFEHASILQQRGLMHLVEGYSIVYRAESLFAESKDTLSLSKRQVGPANSAPVKYPAPKFGQGQCTQRKTLKIRYHLHHSFINRFQNELSSLQFAFPAGGSGWQAWNSNNIQSFVTVFATAISKFIYEPSLEITLLLEKIEAHPNANDVSWNKAGTVLNDRFKRYKCPNDINTMLDDYTKWAPQNALTGASGSLNHMLSDCQRLYPGEGGTVGLAWVGVICSTYNTGTCTYLPGRGGYQCSAHEIGHNFGGPHDFRDGNNDIMSYSNNQYDGFSDQSYSKMCGHLASQGYRCLADTSRTPTPAPAPTPAPCKPNCKVGGCGNDGCGGSCGSCKTGNVCTNGVCTVTCTKKCVGKECGADGCGGTCGTCSGNSACTNGVCVAPPSCTPSCVNKGCGVSDGCSGVCGTGCTSSQLRAGHTCSASTGFKCSPPASTPTKCTPNCNQKLCGDDGCGGSCGKCGLNTVCNTRTFTCQCVPSTSCSALGKTCGTIYNGCQNVECGGPCTCTPVSTAAACGNKKCGFANNGCAQVSCGSCTSGSTCGPNFTCTATDICARCSPFAECVRTTTGTTRFSSSTTTTTTTTTTSGGTIINTSSGTPSGCRCLTGYTGDGITCVPATPNPPQDPASWITDYTAGDDWSLSSDGKTWTNVQPSTDRNSPSLIRWDQSGSLINPSKATISVMVNLQTASSSGGIAFFGQTDDYQALYITGSGNVFFATGAFGQGRTLYSLGTYKPAIGSFVSLSISFAKSNTGTGVMKINANGQTIPANCGDNCLGYNADSIFGTTSRDLDVTLYGLDGVSSFKLVKIDSNAQVSVSLASCRFNGDLTSALSNMMNVEASWIKNLSCSGGGKRGVEQESAIATFILESADPLIPAGVGPSTMAGELVSGGALASAVPEVGPVTVSSLAVAGTAIGEASSIVTATIVAESTTAGLSAGAIAGIVIGSIVGAVALAGAAVVAVKKINENKVDAYQKAPEPQSDPSPGVVFYNEFPTNNPSKPKGGVDVLTNPQQGPGHVSITARGVPLQHNK